MEKIKFVDASTLESIRGISKKEAAEIAKILDLDNMKLLPVSGKKNTFSSASGLYGFSVIPSDNDISIHITVNGRHYINSEIVLTRDSKDFTHTSTISSTSVNNKGKVAMVKQEPYWTCYYGINHPLLSNSEIDQDDVIVMNNMKECKTLDRPVLLKYSFNKLISNYNYQLFLERYAEFLGISCSLLTKTLNKYNIAKEEFLKAEDSAFGPALHFYKIVDGAEVHFTISVSTDIKGKRTLKVTSDKKTKVHNLPTSINDEVNMSISKNSKISKIEESFYYSSVLPDNSILVYRAKLSRGKLKIYKSYQELCDVCVLTVDINKLSESPLNSSQIIDAARTYIENFINIDTPEVKKTYNGRTILPIE